jgi:hypothetical protein
MLLFSDKMIYLKKLSKLMGIPDLASSRFIGTIVWYNMLGYYMLGAFQVAFLLLQKAFCLFRGL